MIQDHFVDGKVYLPQDKYNSLKKTSESDRLVLTQQIKKFEDEMKHSLKVLSRDNN